MASEENRQLNVGDALGYLDAVKMQFQDQPDVYNHFLDIMKDFKSQAIDTPGVIERVSLLFHGSPSLIQGFNTFLPQGYRIDISTDSSQLMVTTPMGTTMQSTAAFGGVRHFPPQYPYEGQYSPGVQGSSTTAAASLLGNLSSVEKQAEGDQFNHAIQYLNKIKDRFADDPHTYKQFLEILQNYQKEQKHLHDSQVYVQVQHLFKDAQDLFAEFKDFLPGVGLGGSPGQWQGEAVGDKPQRKAAASTLKRKKPTEKEPPAPIKQAPSRINKKQKQTHNKPELESYSPYNPPRSPMQSNMPPPPQPIIVSSTDRLQFFDRAKRVLDRELYEEFLKLLNLFTLEIVPAKVLVSKAEVFFGDGDLWREFRDLVLGEPKKHVKSGPPGSMRTGPGFSEAMMASLVDRGQGPSYRRLPESEIRLACSGRNQLDRSVLNDEWVSHPTWASEDVGFMTLKKSQFEDAVLKTEEERHEYHVHIEALSRTISLLDPLNARLDDMSAEERASWRLDPAFGGKSKCVYHKTLRKIYGKEAGNEIIETLQTSPSAALPVVVTRLKQKYEEWRRAQREWNRTWREVDAKNFYKALDHQGISFKGADKKAITSKHFVGDIEAIKAAQEEDDTGPTHQLDYAFEDVDVLQDSLKLVYSFLDHSQSQYSSAERRAIEQFLRSFVPLLFGLSVQEFNAACGPSDISPDDEQGVEGMANGEGHSPDPAENTVLRRRLSRKAKGKQKSTSPEPTDDMEDDIWIGQVPVASADGPNSMGDGSTIPFFTNTTFYTLFRLLQLLYSRLLMCKEIGQAEAAGGHASIQSNPVAVELGLEDPNGPAAILTQAALGSAPGANLMYQYLLTAWEKVFENDLDQGTLEEHLRWFFKNQAYQVYTLDKVIVGLIKQVQTILAENKCQELWTLLQETRNSEEMTNQDVIRYRREAERHLGQDDHLYRVEWVASTKHMKVYLMSSNDPSSTNVGRWRQYVDGYVMKSETEHLPLIAKRPRGVYLRRNIHEDNMPSAGVYNRMKIWVNYGSYKLFYGERCEDVLFRVWSEGEEAEMRARVARRGYS